MQEEQKDISQNEGAEMSAEAENSKTGEVKIKKRTIRILALLLVLGAVVFAVLYHSVAVMVNGKPISRFTVMHGLEHSNGKAYLETLISEKLIADAARAKGIRVSDADVMLELSNIEAGLTAQGAKMDDLLAAQGMTREVLKKQMVIRKQVEQLLADKVAVTDAEIDQYISDSKITLEAGKEAESRTIISEQLRGQKLQKEAGAYVDSLRATANLRFFGIYKTESVVAPAVQQVAQ